MNKGQKITLFGAIGLLAGSLLPLATIFSITGEIPLFEYYRARNGFVPLAGMIIFFIALDYKGKPGKTYSVFTIILAAFAGSSSLRILNASVLAPMDINPLYSVVRFGIDFPGALLCVVGAILAVVGGAQKIEEIPEEEKKLKETATLRGHTETVNETAGAKIAVGDMDKPQKKEVQQRIPGWIWLLGIPLLLVAFWSSEVIQNNRETKATQTVFASVDITRTPSTAGTATTTYAPPVLVPTTTQVVFPIPTKKVTSLPIPFIIPPEGYVFVNEHDINLSFVHPVGWRRNAETRTSPDGEGVMKFVSYYLVSSGEIQSVTISKINSIFQAENSTELISQLLGTDPETFEDNNFMIIEHFDDISIGGKSSSAVSYTILDTSEIDMFSIILLLQFDEESSYIMQWSSNEALRENTRDTFITMLPTIAFID